ncbi:hypothetical protein CERSUDRAFT_79422 [Gelatoporia subvermispora B]|uniref:Uncharacterized protein n=1 Tax=Ceriporiopsis subvermispora (strain B) TaxID=914234 RepID=M2RS90_CERS8|nr:hypothetical protein CERSUDRAFT_79422 [Gelatoporia subvermispora B]
MPSLSWVARPQQQVAHVERMALWHVEDTRAGMGDVTFSVQQEHDAPGRELRYAERPYDAPCTHCRLLP